ncbi:MAG: RHS repeat domain-containing protein [Anaerolineae bacterium]
MADFIRRNGDEIVYSYDAAGRLTRKDYPDGSWAAYTYEWPAT